MKLADYADEVAPYIPRTKTANRHNNGTTIWVSKVNAKKLQALGTALAATAGTRPSSAHGLAALIAYLEDFDA